MTKLTDAQLVILNRAAQRDDHGVAKIDKRPGTREVVAKLIKAKLLMTIPKAADLAIWDRAKDGSQLSLKITAAGFKALGLEADGAASTTEAKIAEQSDAAGKASTKPKQAAKGPKVAAALTADAVSNGKQPRHGSKLATVIGLLRQPKGTTLADIMSATGWQAHSVRGALSGALKKKLGLLIVSERIDDTRHYRIEA